MVSRRILTFHERRIADGKHIDGSAHLVYEETKYTNNIYDYNNTEFNLYFLPQLLL